MTIELLSCDVLIVGAGAAGCSAAVAAGRAGAEVILVEQSDGPGGTYTAAGLGTVCGVYPGQDGRLREALTGGKFTRSFLARLRTTTPDYAPLKLGRVHVAPCSAPRFREILDRELRSTVGLRFVPDARVCAVSVEGSTLRGVQLYVAGEPTFVSARAVVDCSGCGAVITRCPGAAEIPRTRMLAAMGFVVRDTEGYSEVTSFQAAYHLDDLWRKGNCPAWWRLVTLRAEPEGRQIRGWFNFPPGSYACPADVSGDIVQLHGFLRSSLDGWKRSEAVVWGRVHPRDGPTLVGEEKLRGVDVLAAGEHPEGSVVGLWPQELWSADRGQELVYGEGSRGYRIPDGCLRSATHDGLFSAGKCISADREGLGAARVVGTCFDTGERAAILALKRLGGRMS